MKKLFLSLLCGVMVLGLSTGCGKQTTEETPNNDNTNTENSSKEEQNKIKVGDKVNYDELSNGIKNTEILYTENGGKSSQKNQSLSTEDLEWRVLNVKEDGTVDLISTTPTATPIYIYGVSKAPEILDNTCNELYSKGIGAISARNLQIDDIDKLANISNDQDKKNISSSYGVKWIYRYSKNSNSIEYSSDGGKTFHDTKSSTFKIPGKYLIDAKNSQVEIINSKYDYSLVNYISSKTSDNINMSDLITKGENGANYVTQWLSSSSYTCNEYNAYFDMRILISGWVKSHYLINSSSDNVRWFHYAYRPVVTLDSNVTLTKDANGVWQINKN